MRMSVVLLLSALVFVSGAVAQGGSSEMADGVVPIERIPHVVAFNELDGKKNSSRVVVILVKKHAFKEDNLLHIFRWIQSRYPRPIRLHVEFFSEIEDIETPAHREGPHMTRHNQSGDRSHRGDYAVFIRISKNKYGNCLIYFADGRISEVQIR